jgi:replicative DNA helicase Mcm
MDIQERWRARFRRRRADVGRLAEEYPETRSLYVDVLDLHEEDRDLTEALLSEPDRVLRAGAETLADLTGVQRVNVRVENHPGLLFPATVGARHVGELVTVEGVAAEVRAPVAGLERGRYACVECGEECERTATGIEDPAPAACPSCGGAVALSRGRSQFRDVQRVRVEEDGGDGGIDVYLDDDIVGAVTAADPVVVTGVVRVTNRQRGLFEYYLSALSVETGTARRPDEEDAVGDLIRSRWESID